MSKDDFSPNAILELAQHNPTVHQCLMLWKRGDLRWEEALSLAVVHLAAQNEKLLETAQIKMESQPWFVLACSRCKGPYTPWAENPSPGMCRACAGKKANSFSP